ncbi:hypothetical protein AAG906_002341 [Vitis piasezkii]
MNGNFDFLISLAKMPWCDTKKKGIEVYPLRRKQLDWTPLNSMAGWLLWRKHLGDTNPMFYGSRDRMAKRANFISSLQPYSDPLVHCRGIESEISKQICYSDKESLDKFSIEESLDRSYSSILIASWNKIQVFLSSDPVEERLFKGDDNKVSWKLEPQL